MARILKIIIATLILNMCGSPLDLAAKPDPGKKPQAQPFYENPSARMPIITVVYDNNPYGEGLETAWGFSCLIKGMEKTILFDTGGSGKILLANMSKMGVVPDEIDTVVISHIHGDQVGGVHSLIAENRRIITYLPGSFPEPFFQDMKKRGSRVIPVRDPIKIGNGVYSTGELGEPLREQSLIVRTL